MVASDFGECVVASGLTVGADTVESNRTTVVRALLLPRAACAYVIGGFLSLSEMPIISTVAWTYNLQPYVQWGNVGRKCCLS